LPPEAKATRLCRPHRKECGFPFDTGIHELGYVAVKESYWNRGLSYKIAAKLLSEFGNRPLFATTSNPYMKRTLEKLGFIQRGNEWRGKDGNLLSLWITGAASPK
jgi:hypothetical protein